MANDEILWCYGTCQYAVRSLDTCLYVAGMLQFLSNAGYQNNIKYPDGSFLNATINERVDENIEVLESKTIEKYNLFSIIQSLRCLAA